MALAPNIWIAFPCFQVAQGAVKVYLICFLHTSHYTAVLVLKVLQEKCPFKTALTALAALSL